METSSRLIRSVSDIGAPPGRCSSPANSGGSRFVLKSFRVRSGSKTMKARSFSMLAGLTLLISMAHVLPAESAELTLFCVPALRPVLNEIAPQFERATGHVLTMKFDFVPSIVRQIEAGGAFDLVIVEPPAIDKMIDQGKVIRASRTDVAQVGLGLGVRAGAVKPDIGSVAAFRRTLMEARSIAYQPDRKRKVLSWTARAPRRGCGCERQTRSEGGRRCRPQCRQRRSRDGRDLHAGNPGHARSGARGALAARVAVLHSVHCRHRNRSSTTRCGASASRAVDFQ
jgi:Bacterial extracellular solute-binding protein